MFVARFTAGTPTSPFAAEPAAEAAFVERGELVEIVLKRRIGGGDAGGVGDGGFALREKAENGAGHGDAMIAEAADFRADEGRAADDGHAVLVLGYGDAESAEIGGRGGDAVGFLDSQLAGVADFGFTVGDGGDDGDDRQLVDDVGDLGAADLRPAQLASIDADVADRFAGGIGDGFGDVGAHSQQDAE